MAANLVEVYSNRYSTAPYPRRRRNNWRPSSIPKYVIRRTVEQELSAIQRRTQTYKERFMKFLSIYKSPERGVPPTQEEMDKMGKLIEQEMKAGTLLATEGCLPSALGARVRISGGKVTVTDGPFTEAKEVIGGFAILQANSKAEAIEMTKRFLEVAGEGECELRQVYEAPQAHSAVKC